MKRNVKTIIGLLIAFIIGISTTVGATTIFNSKDVTYNSDKTEATNVKDSLDELYIKASKIGECPDGILCRESLVKNVQLGDYIRMTPTSTSYTISKDLTGYTSDQTINPSELNLWRVIRKNVDGSIEVKSVYTSSTPVEFSGKTGYMKFVGTLNRIAEQYTNSKYVQNTRYIGYNDQIEWCGTLSASSCPDNTKQTSDVYSPNSDFVYGLEALNLNGGETGYWLPYRYFKSTSSYGLMGISTFFEAGGP